MDMYTKLPSKVAKNCCCHSDRKFNYLYCYCTCLQVLSSLLLILGRNTDLSASVDILNIDYCVAGNIDEFDA